MGLTTPPTPNDVLRSDLASFADPGTLVDVAPGDQETVVHWQQGGRSRTGRFTLGQRSDLRDTTVRADGDGARVAYATFLAGETMADLRSVARNTMNVVSAVQAFVPPHATAEDPEERGQADDLILKLADGQTDRTVVVFVTADAGAGKTSLLTEMVRWKASGYLLGKEPVLWLYVNAQGSRLARLDQALAATLDDVRAMFPYHATASLVRTGALVLVVDGFDELIGTQGTYDEAFSSLASFIELLMGGGTLVAAARSAYYEQEFATRADSTIGFRTDKWSLRPLSIAEWNSTERDLFLERFAAARQMSRAEADALADQLHQTFDHPRLRELAYKPLFVARVTQLLAEGVLLEQGDDLVDRLLSTYLRREVTEKLKSAKGTPLLSVDQLRDYYTEIANEMWRQETRELTRTSLRELVGILAELQGLDDDGRLTVIEKTPYSAVMRSGSATGSAAFEHELYFSHFLSKPIVAALSSGEPYAVTVALRKGRLPDGAGDLIGKTVKGDAQTTIDLLQRAATMATTGSDQIRQNAGLIVTGLLDDAPPLLRLNGIDFIDCNLSGARVTAARFESCVFRGANLAGAQFLKSAGTDLEFDRVSVDSSTLLELEGVSVESFFSLEVLRNGRRETLYSPEQVAEELKKLGLPAAAAPPIIRHVDSGALDALQLLCRLYERTNLATADDSNLMQRVVQSHSWKALRKALIDSGVIREELRSVRPSGAHPKVFMRMLVRPRDLLSGQAVEARVDERIDRFWKLMESQ